MNFQVISLMPEMILSGLKEGVVAAAIDKKMIEVECVNPRRFTTDVHHSVDDRPFGGGDGMIMTNDPVEKSIAYFNDRAIPDEIIYLSARGEVFNDQTSRELAQKKRLTLICGRYGGIDQRVLARNRVREISIGDFILSGGELAALVLIDAVSRHLPGVLGNEISSESDSFSDGLLEAPSFTRPREWKDVAPPAVLLSGDHKKIKEWRESMSLLATIETRDDLFGKKEFEKGRLTKALSLLDSMTDEDLKNCGILNSAKIKRRLAERMDG